MRALLLATSFLIAATPAFAEDVSTLLERQSQAMYDALIPANPKVWDDALDTDALITDENGVFMTKKQMVASVTPFPKGIGGHIVLTDWRVVRHGDTAVAAYVVDEHEDFHGQHLHALYRETATWMKEAGGWKRLAMQTIALQQDPPAVQLSDAALDQYAGRYRAAPDLVYAIARKGHALIAGVVGGKPAALKIEIADVAFTPGQPRVRKLFQRDSAGHITGFLSRREGRDVVWKKIA
jgi:uncharacterized protein DUF4440